ncbi:nuclear transport factor 2 family protein [Stenotrophomonas sp. SY1]|uniref:nuclear transport factor 2 family protein n=1 Tax=Stenotrophomonas sp. SY1 TaxID=477235 RepID=UPI001E641034|nr:nuclear transport factor 2 family protein [Stenotrophomonas sp. SY1]MCD9085800.1 nuclear transport factor 2 family protein [Stenotrophomonas sp. SY1]
MNKLLCLLLAVAPLTAYAASADVGQDTLHATIAALDQEVFDSFNRCADPAQLHKHAGYFDAAVEFYHDTGGVTWTREAMLANTARHVCGNFTRQLLPETLEVFPIKDFGAIARGQHRFCDSASGKCEGLADFTIIWRLRDGQWQITRVLSYAHRASGGTPTR